MATPSYTTDLTDYSTLDASVTVIEFSGWIAGSKPGNPDTDNAIQGTGHLSIEQRTAAKGSIALNGTDPAGFTETTGGVTGDCFFIWGQFLQAGAVESFFTSVPADAGIVMMLGSGTSDFTYWPVGGNDFGRAPYGGYTNWVVDPTDPASTGTNSGSPTAGVYSHVGFGCNVLNAISKGSPYNMDAVRWGRGELIVTGGDATDGYANFSELSNANDANDISFVGDLVSGDATVTNISDTSELYPGAPISGTGIPGSTTIKSITNSTTIEMSSNATATNAAVSITSKPYNVWGLLQEQFGTFLWKGLISLGTAGTLVDFRDSNRFISIDDTRNVETDFNRFEINNASSNIEWTSINITSLGTQAKGQLEVIDSATLNFDTCVFTDMGTFIFNGVNNTLTDCTFRRCDLVTQGSATLTNVTFDQTSANVALLSTAATAASIDGCDFTGDNTSHAVNLGTVSSSTTANWNSTFDASTYAASDEGPNATSSSGDSEVILVNVASGQTLTISVTGVASPTYRNTGPGTVLIANEVQVTISNVIEGSEVRMWNYSGGPNGGPANTEVEISGGVESIANTDTLTTGSVTFNVEANLDVLVKVFKTDFNIERFVLNSGDGTTRRVDQSRDRVFSNP
jgi:hypothetical protein